jgi:hypothetical protein
MTLLSIVVPGASAIVGWLIWLEHREELAARASRPSGEVLPAECETGHVRPQEVCGDSTSESGEDLNKRRVSMRQTAVSSSRAASFHRKPQLLATIAQRCVRNSQTRGTVDERRCAFAHRQD